MIILYMSDQKESIDCQPASWDRAVSMGGTRMSRNDAVPGTRSSFFTRYLPWVDEESANCWSIRAVRALVQ